jgi:hypothetical protein
VAEVKASWRAGRRRTYRPWIAEPGLWLQFDWGTGPVVPGPDGRARATLLFCAWLAWSRFRVVIPTWDRRLGTLLACLDATLRRLGGVPTYALTDNEKTVTVEHVAGIPVRHPMIVAAGRHYGLQVHTCVPLVRSSDRPLRQVARELGVDHETLRNWVRTAERRGHTAHDLRPQVATYFQAVAQRA